MMFNVGDTVYFTDSDFGPLKIIKGTIQHKNHNPHVPAIIANMDHYYIRSNFELFKTPTELLRFLRQEKLDLINTYNNLLILLNKDLEEINEQLG